MRGTCGLDFSDKHKHTLIEQEEVLTDDVALRRFFFVLRARSCEVSEITDNC
jgi:hypothetical protein